MTHKQSRTRCMDPMFAWPQCFRFLFVGTLTLKTLVHSGWVENKVLNHSQLFQDLWKGATVHNQMCPLFLRGVSCCACKLWSMALISFNCDGIDQQACVPPGQTINQHYYWEVLQWLKEKFTENVQNDEWWWKQELVYSPPQCASIRHFISAKIFGHWSSLFLPAEFGLFWILLAYDH